jgi:SulP family sulfate permease
MRGGYGWPDCRLDIGAGIVAGIVALPLSMALAIASGVPPQQGLYTAIVAGGLIALLGGSRVSVSGPTAAFVVVLAPITARFGPGGLALATVMAGILMLVMGLARLGQWIQLMPHPVITGFTSGIAVVIAMLQLKDFLGLDVPAMPGHFVERLQAIVVALPSFRWQDLSTGLVTLAILIAWPRINRRIPAPLIGLVVASAGAWAAGKWFPLFDIITINDRFSWWAGEVPMPGIPQTPPVFAWPWLLPDCEGRPIGLSLELLRALSMPAMTIAILGAIESLLCAVVADGMTGFKHDPDGELMAQGIGNMVAPFFGGFAATAAIARTATGIRAGSRSPVAAMVHSVFVLLAILGLAPLLGYLPMASLAALLLVVAWRMSEAGHFIRIICVAPRSDTIVLAVCFALTVFVDMAVSVTVGVVLASLLFMRRMADLSHVRLVQGSHPQLIAELPPDVRLYEIAGPLFFGAAARAASQLAESVGEARVVMLYLGDVPMIDMTGLVALESTIQKLHRAGILVVLADVNADVASTISRSKIIANREAVSVHDSIPGAEMFVRLILPERRHDRPAVPPDHAAG